MEVTAKEERQFKSSINLKKFAEKVKYEKLNPSIIQQRILTNPQYCEADIVHLIELFLTEGPNLRKHIRRREPTEANRLCVLRQRYHLFNDVKGRGKNAINLARLAIAFPQITARILHRKRKMKRPVAITTMKEIVPGFPTVLMSPITASLLPNDDKSKYYEVLFATALYVTYENMCLNKKLKDDIGEAARNALKYVRLAFKSEMLDNKEKEEIVVSNLFNRVFKSKDNEIVCSNSVKEAARTFKLMYTTGTDKGGMIKILEDARKRK